MRSTLFLLVLSASACTLEGREFFDMPVELDAKTDGLVRSDGATVALDQAVLGFADLRLHHDHELRVARVLGGWTGTAVAHPGHEGVGAVVGELLGTWELDLLGEATYLGEARMVEGAVSTGEARLVGPAVTLGGTLTPVGGEPQRFHVVVDAEEILSDVAVNDEVWVEEAPALRLDVDLRPALEAVELLPTTAGVRFGITDPTAWRASLRNRLD